MRRFQSRVDVLKRVREQAERLARIQAAARRAELEQARSAEQHLARQIVSLDAESAAAARSGLLAFLPSAHLAAARLAAEKSAAAAQCREAESRVADAVAEIARTRQDVQVAEKYVDRERTAHRKQVLSEEELNRQERTAQRFQQQKPVVR